MNIRNLNVATFVPPEGYPDSPYVIVGEQPGAMEVKLRKPFVGPAGKLLMECLQTTGIIRKDCYLTNVVKTYDKKIYDYISFKNRKLTISPDWHQYVEILKEELMKTSGVIVATGNVPLFALTDNWGITKWRGSVLESTLLPGRKVVPMIHPATVIPPKNQYLNKLLILWDLTRARDVATGKFQESKYEIIIRPSYVKCMEYLDECIRLGLEGYTIDYDIEVKNEQVSCISFAHNPVEAISIPFVAERGDYFTPEQEYEVWIKIARIIQDPKINKRGQNITFDAHFMLRNNAIIAHNLDDTMVAQRTLMSEFPAGLDFITSIWTTHPYYKDEGKRYFEGGNWPRLWAYNGTDSLVCAEAFPKQLQELIKQKNIPAYQRQRDVIEPLIFMMERGILADVEGIKRESDRLEKDIEDLRRQLDAHAGEPLNPNSPKQLQNYFYGRQGHKAYKKRGTGNVTTDNDAMKRLVRKGSKEAALIQKIRKAGKIRSTYLNPEKFDKDSRIRCSYNPVGTRYSRLSSSENIFGTGMNMQNWPHSILKYLMADPGYLYYSFDLAQAENRLVAYLGRVHQMIDAFETGKDVHSLTAGLILGKPPEEISDEPGSCSLGGGEHSERFWGKKGNHGLNYDLGHRAFSFYYEIPERDGKFIVDRYHLSYPGVRQNFHEMVKRELRSSRTLTNLMGRKTKFLGKLDDETFKAAYACIPQGTVGDIINEKGLNYVYYNQHLFSPVELLIQVHDSLGFQIPLSVPWDEVAEMLMLIKRSLEVPLKVHEYDFFIPADLNFGFTLDKDHEIELKDKKIPKNYKDFAVLLEEKYEERKESFAKEREKADVGEDTVGLDRCVYGVFE